MNYVYPAVFYEEEGKISVIFPDLGNLATFGDNVADAIPMWLNTLCEEKSINFSKVLQDALLTKVQSL